MSKSMPVCEGSPGAEVGARPLGNSCSSHFPRSTDKNKSEAVSPNIKSECMGPFLCCFPTKNSSTGVGNISKTIKFTNSKGREIFPSKQLPKTQAHVNFWVQENITHEISRMKAIENGYGMKLYQSTCEEMVVYVRASSLEWLFHHIPHILHLRCTNKHAKSPDCHHGIMPNWNGCDMTLSLPAPLASTPMLVSSGTKLLLPHWLHKLEHSPGLLGKSWHCCCHGCVSIMKRNPVHPRQIPMPVWGEILVHHQLMC